MAKGPCNSTHRPQKESEAKRLAELQRENRSLRRQVARLQKELGRATKPSSEKGEGVPQKKRREICPLCGAALVVATFRTPAGKDFNYCKSCKGRLEKA